MIWSRSNLKVELLLLDEKYDKFLPWCPCLWMSSVRLLYVFISSGPRSYSFHHSRNNLSSYTQREISVSPSSLKFCEWFFYIFVVRRSEFGSLCIKILLFECVRFRVTLSSNWLEMILFYFVSDFVYLIDLRSKSFIIVQRLFVLW